MYNTYLRLEEVKKNPFLEKAQNMTPPPTFDEAKEKLPKPIFEGSETEINAYYDAWKIAFRNTFSPNKGNGFVSPYIDAAFNGHIFMWDSCFMMLFGRYADAAFRFQGTLDNFYCKQEPDGFIGREISEEDGKNNFERFEPPSTGPEIMPWCEWLYYLNYGDRERLKEVYFPLLGFHKWMKNYHRWKDGSYWSTGWGCGMDNLPRRDLSAVPGTDEGELRPFHHSFMSWIDANFQALLSCECLLKMAAELGIDDGVDELKAERDFLEKFTNEKMWSEKEKFYFDRLSGGELLPVKTVAGFWGLVAGAVPDERVDDFVAHLENENEFNRHHRVPSLSADHPDYDPKGGYWNGGVWAPTVYMILRGLSKYGKDELAREIALNHYGNVLEVYKKTGTFWENYAPEMTEEGYARRDFVGWTGIVPISVFIEYILGIRVEAQKDEIIWRIDNLNRHGIERIPVGRNEFADLVCERRKDAAEKPVVTVRSDKPLTVKVFYGNNNSYVLSAEQTKHT